MSPNRSQGQGKTLKDRVQHSSTLLLQAWCLLAASLMVGPAWADQPGDAWITTKAKIALLTSDEVDGLDIDVDTVDGRVTLHGKVNEAAQKARAEEIVQQVNGVRRVEAMLSIVPEAARDVVDREDGEIRGQIETVLKRDAALSGSDISVRSVNDGNVVLSGEAETLSAHRRALEDVRAVKGVRSIASQIESPDRLGDAEIHSDAEPVASTSAAGDAWITAKTKVRLMAEPGLSPFSVDVDTRSSVVTLFGIVGSEDLKARAGAEAAQVGGVKGVENELQVVPDVAADRQQKTDALVLEGVEEQLTRAPELAGARIQVEVKNSVVRLTGTVGSQEERNRALALTRGTSGVDSVIDRLELGPPRG